MTDDNALQPHEPVAEGSDPVFPEAVEVAADDTPASEVKAVDTDEPEQLIAEAQAAPDDHSMWMRPPDGEEAPIRYDEVELDVTPDGDLEPFEPGVVEEVVREGESPADELLPENGEAALVGARAAAARTEDAGASLEHAPEPATEPTHDDRPGWMALWPWIAGAVALGLIAFGLIFANTRKTAVVVTETPTPTPTAPPVIQPGDLMSVSDANQMSKQAWTAQPIIDKITSNSPHPPCVLNNPGQPNSILSSQRTLTSTAKTALSALHQADNYATVADAQKVFQLRSGNLGACTDQPLWIAGADTVEGLGDQASSTTVVFQEQVPQYHTVLMVRSGTTVHMVDVAQNDKAVAAADVAKALVGPVQRQCGRAKGNCAASPKVQATLPPAAGTPGWLLAADLPRVTPGAGMWSGTETKAIDTTGSYCEQVDLTTVAGPKQREQRTYLMTQDTSAPQNFGLDEVVFTFEKPADAAKFASTLSSNVRDCAKKVATAKIAEPNKVTGKTTAGAFAGDTYLVSQALGGNQTAYYRVGVVAVGNRVIYLLSNPTKAYDLKAPTFGTTMVRAAERSSQAR